MSSVGTKFVRKIKVQANHFPVSLKQAEVTRVQSVMRISLARSSLLHYWFDQGTRCPNAITRPIAGRLSQEQLITLLAQSRKMWSP